VTVAVVDIGTNSTRLLIAEIEDGRVTNELDRQTTVTRLGAGVDAHGHLSSEAIERVNATLDRYAERIERQHATTRIAILTSAVRDATNGRNFAAEVADRYGLATHVLTGDEEARLTFLGAMSDRDPNETTPTLVADIGGGSTELVIGTDREPGFHVSTQAGVVRQSERHLHHDPPTRDELAELTKDVDDIVNAAVPHEQRQAVRHAIAVAGTPTSLAAIAQRLDPYDPEKTHGYVLTVDQAEDILEWLIPLPLEQRRRVTGLHPDRAPTIVAGVVILIQTLKLFGLETVEVSEHDILRGAALELS
jgi:exopolyphosphatase/guanosine-5'-triphosphate,3'-diphosphate pyrophosphatase